MHHEHESNNARCVMMLPGAMMWSPSLPSQPQLEFDSPHSLIPDVN